MDSFEPELGQMAFGQPWKQHACAPIVEAVLRAIDDELGRVHWNTTQTDYSSPFGNTGESFKCDAFEVHAYSWSDDEQPFNFKWRDVEISWYKYLGRGMSSSKPISPDLAAEMLNDCVAALHRYEEARDAENA